MKQRVVKNIRTSLLSVVLVAGLVYAVLALSTMPASASNYCDDCQNGPIDAYFFCWNNYGSPQFASFDCLGNGYYVVQCYYDPQQLVWTNPCP